MLYNKKQQLFYSFITLFLLLVLIFGFALNTKAVTNSKVLSGWAWSENIGWISFNSENLSNSPISYNVNYSPSDGVMSGYAWSDNVGWITFNQSELTGCPSGECKAVMNGNSVSGWARTLSSTETVTVGGVVNTTTTTSGTTGTSGTSGTSGKSGTTGTVGSCNTTYSNASVSIPTVTSGNNSSLDRSYISFSPGTYSISGSGTYWMDGGGGVAIFYISTTTSKVLPASNFFYAATAGDTYYINTVPDKIVISATGGGFTTRDPITSSAYEMTPHIINATDSSLRDRLFYQSEFNPNLMLVTAEQHSNVGARPWNLASTTFTVPAGKTYSLRVFLSQTGVRGNFYYSKSNTTCVGGTSGTEGTPGTAGTPGTPDTTIETSIITGGTSYSIPAGGGWDGWISLSGMTTGNPSSNYGPQKSGKEFAGFSWGGGDHASTSVIGWISVGGNVTSDGTIGGVKIDEYGVVEETDPQKSCTLTMWTVDTLGNETSSSVTVSGGASIGYYDTSSADSCVLKTCNCLGATGSFSESTCNVSTPKKYVNCKDNVIVGDAGIWVEPSSVTVSFTNTGASTKTTSTKVKTNIQTGVSGIISKSGEACELISGAQSFSANTSGQDITFTINKPSTNNQDCTVVFTPSNSSISPTSFRINVKKGGTIEEN